MRALIIAGILSLGAITPLFAAENSGFVYVPAGNGQCQVLTDGKSGKPILETNKRAPSKVVLVGIKAECPNEYDGYKVNRLASGFTNGFIYNGVQDSGRKVFIFRKFGSDFTFRYGPKPN